MWSVIVLVQVPTLSKINLTESPKKLLNDLFESLTMLVKVVLESSKRGYSVKKRIAADDAMGFKSSGNGSTSRNTKSICSVFLSAGPISNSSEAHQISVFSFPLCINAFLRLPLVFTLTMVFESCWNLIISFWGKLTIAINASYCRLHLKLFVI